MGGDKKTKVGLVSLGCPKNLVDSEVMLGLLAQQGCEITNDEREAEVLVVNTCAFIEEAKRESVDAILDAAKLKNDGVLKKLIVTGCLAQRYRGELETEMPEVDHFIGTGEFPRIAEFVRPEPSRPPARSAVSRPEYLYDYATPRIPALPKHTAYVKIAEGCSRVCSFCIIPKLRGEGRSRTVDSVVREAERLASEGALEVNLIAQDLTAYGRDLGDGTNLEKLLRRLVRIGGLRWIRLMYAYPTGFSDALVDLIAASEKICKYVDLPLQHVDGALLAAMRRNVDERGTRGLIGKLRRRIPGLTLRTTLIVGFPGETEAQFERLCDFVRETEFERLGVFTYSREEGTGAAGMPDQIPEGIKEERKDRIMRLQRGISARKNEELLGRTVEVLVDGKVKRPDGYGYVGRTQGQALEIDGNVFLRGKDLPVGRFVSAEVVSASEYDLGAQARSGRL